MEDRKSQDRSSPDRVYSEVMPKTNIKFSKRFALLLGFAGVLVIFALLHFSNNRSANNSQPQGGAVSYQPATNHKYNSSEEMETERPSMTLDDEDGSKVEDRSRYNVNEGSTNHASANDDIKNKQRELSRQWIEHQRLSFLSPPSVTGSWERNSSASEVAAGSSQNPTVNVTEQGNPRKNLLDMYQDLSSADSASAMSKKEAFFSSSKPSNGYLSSTRTEAISPYVLPAGTLIPCTLISGINSDLPGNITATVTENVYDWSRPNVVLIPQGAKVFGVYDSQIAFAQKRVQISWTRLIYPDGSYIDLNGMPGTDREGYSGLRDKYYPRYGRLLTAAVTTAALGSVGLLFEDNNNNGTVVTTSTGSTVVVPNNSVGKEIGKNVAESIGNMGQNLFDKMLNTPPTILIRPGTRFNIQVNADIPFYSAWK